MLDILQPVLSQYSYLTQIPRSKIDEEFAGLYDAALDCNAVATKHMQYLDVCKIGVKSLLNPGQIGLTSLISHRPETMTWTQQMLPDSEPSGNRIPDNQGPNSTRNRHRLPPA